jgi:hypothetical protein
MCDDCGTVFSENAEGISQGVMVDPDTGRQRALDYCDVCSDIKSRMRKGLGFMRRAANSPAELTTSVDKSSEVG